MGCLHFALQSERRQKCSHKPMKKRMLFTNTCCHSSLCSFAFCPLPLSATKVLGGCKQQTSGDLVSAPGPLIKKAASSCQSLGTCTNLASLSFPSLCLSGHDCPVQSHGWGLFQKTQALHYIPEAPFLCLPLVELLLSAVLSLLAVQL